MKKTNFENKFTPQCHRYYNIVNEYAKRLKLTNTLIALDLACNLHDGMYRDGGQPYIIHPLEIMHYLIVLNVKSAIMEQNENDLHDSVLAEEATIHQLDILLATIALHDTVEDCREKLPNKSVTDFEVVYHLDSDIVLFVDILTKDKTKSDYSDKSYYDGINSHWQTLLAKVLDRANNCSTIDAFSKERMAKYVIETRAYFYTMCSTGKNSWPEFSRIFTILKFLLVSICETVSASLSLKDIIVPASPDKTYHFIQGFALGKNMQNTQKALPLAKMYYEKYNRKTGDPFIIHPLRVTSYLIALKINTDEICAAALLHEIINTCHLDYNGVEIINKYHLAPIVWHYICLLANAEKWPLNVYYDVLKQYPEVLILKLSNRAHTCTKLLDWSDEEIKSYIDECEKYIYPLCEYGIKHYPMYANSIEIARFHISSTCNIAKTLRKK